MKYASWIALLVAAGCVETVSGEDLVGTYQVTLREEGPCEGPFTESVPSPSEQYFQLRDDTLDGNQLMAFHTCSNAETCSDTRDIPRSFRIASGGWRGTHSTFETGCVLRHRVRWLYPTGDGIEIEQTIYRETDDTLVGDACNAFEARERGESMPCVSVVRTFATKL